MSARRLVLPVLVTTLGVLVFASAPALAAAPEKPETIEPARSITATTATFEGVLNPKASVAVEAGWYFAYSTEPYGLACTDAFTTVVEPEEGVKAKPVSVEVTGLEPNKLYTFCLVATSEGATQVTPGNEVSVKTEPAAPEVLPGSESAPAPTASEVTLNAQVNPNNEKTAYFFEYAASEAEVLAGKGTRVAGAPPAAELENFGGQGAAVAVPGLTPGTVYYYRVVAENAQSVKEAKPVTGEVEHFVTGPPEKPELLKAEPVTGTTATLNGVLNPGQEGNPGSYEFLYRQSPSECQGGAPEEDKLTPVQGAAGSVGEEAKAEVTGLLPKHDYTFCLLARNEAGEPSTLSAPVTFETGVIGASLVEAGGAEAVTATSAELTGELNPGGEATYYFEYGTAQCDEVAVTCGAATAESGPLSGEIEQAANPAVVSALRPDTIYHYWLVAKNASGTVHSAPAEFRTSATQAEVEAEAAAERKPAEETAAAAAAVNQREAEARGREAAAAVTAAAQSKQYDELAALTTGLLTPKLAPTTTPPKTTTPKVVKCKKGYTKKHNKCVKSKKRSKQKKDK
jgi:hypothetical protein